MAVDDGSVEILDDGAEQYADITEEEIRAFGDVRAAVRRICADKELAEVPVIFVDRVDGSELNAEFRSEGAGPSIYVARGVACELTPAARRWLLVHEIGHYWYDKPWRRTLLAFRVLATLLSLVLLVGVVLHVTQPSSTADMMSPLALLALVPLYLWFQGRRRADEARADDFAVLHEGEMTGAEECMQAWNEARPERSFRSPLMRRLRLTAQSHPWRDQRLASMAATLERTTA